MPDSTTETFIGLMSGTSIDAIDAAAVTIDNNNNIDVVATHTHPIPDEIKHSIASLCQPGENEIMRMGKLDCELGDLFADATLELLRLSNIGAPQVTAIGSHGQTIRHSPNGEHPFTLQIANPARISECTNITTVADFRRSDMAAGGQGAPLVPAFHHAVFFDEEINRVILNIGGMANISILEKNEEISGFDTGPGNILLNEWIQQQQKLPYDNNGEWSKSNSTNTTLIEQMLDDPYFPQSPPKSTGREYFNLNWVKGFLADTNDTPGNIQSTLCELTARSISDAVRQYAKNCQQILVCGGGAHNKDLMSRLQKHCDTDICSTAKYGLDPDYVEAAAFAWFARQTLHGEPSNAPAVTGAKHPVLLGAIYPVFHPR